MTRKHNIKRHGVWLEKKLKIVLDSTEAVCYITGIEGNQAGEQPKG